MKQLDILMDMHGRLGPIEGAVEGILAQNRDFLARLKTLEAKLDVLSSENRQWRRHVERLLRQKEALLEAHGVRALETNHRALVHGMTGAPFNEYCNLQR